MRIPLPAALDSRQRVEDTRGLALVAPSVSAAASDDRAAVLRLGDHEHRVPAGWDVAEGRHGEYSLAFLRQGTNVRVLVGTRDHGVREVTGYRQDVRRAILENRFGEQSQQTSDATEVDRLVALSDSLEGSVSDDAEADRLANLAAEL